MSLVTTGHALVQSIRRVKGDSKKPTHFLVRIAALDSVVDGSVRYTYFDCMVEVMSNLVCRIIYELEKPVREGKKAVIGFVMSGLELDQDTATLKGELVRINTVDFGDGEALEFKMGWPPEAGDLLLGR